MKKLISLLLAVITTSAIAESTPKCFLFPDNQTPESLPVEDTSATQTWCYATTPRSKATLVFRSDGELNDETAFLVEPNRSKSGFAMTHASRAYGELDWFTQGNVEFNPFPAPLTIAEAKKTALAETVAPEFSRLKNLGEILLRAQTKPRQSANNMSFYLEEDDIPPTETAAIAADKEPEDGYWWPHDREELFNTDFSPTAQYDAYVKKLTGTDPKSREWESLNHSLKGVPWGGHCNGWAASTILYPFFDKSRWNTDLDMPLSANTFQGMRAETSFCVDWAFYGTRYNKPGDDIDDIRPKKFYDVLRYYIKNLGKAVVMDYFVAEEIDNNIISGYEFKYSLTPEGNMRVDATLTAHAYSMGHVNTKKIARKYNRTYSFEFIYDAQGNYESDKWLGDHPDFLWVPLAQKKCGRENPRMDHKYVDQLQAENYPEAEHVVTDWKAIWVENPVPAGQSVEFPEPFTGAGVKLYFDFYSVPASPDVKLKMTFKKGTGADTYVERPISSGYLNFENADTLQVKKIEVINPTSVDIKLNVSRYLEYWKKK